MGVLIANGTYSGTSGALSAHEDPTALAGFQLLDIVSNGVWYGPANVANANTIPASINIVSVPEPAGLGLLALGGAGLLVRKRRSAN